MRKPEPGRRVGNLFFEKLSVNKKILHIINGEFYAGAERVQDLLAINLPEFGYDVGFACLKNGIFESARQATTAPLHTLPMSNRVDFRVVLQLLKIIKNNNYQLLHTHTPRTALIGQAASLLNGVPMVHHVHGPTTLDTEHPWRNYRNATIERLSVLRAKRFIPVSTYAKKFAASIGIKNSKMSMVWNGVSTPDTPCLPRQPGPFVIGSVALFRPRKGVEILIEAAAKLKSTTENQIQLLMVGEFETLAYEKSIKALAHQLGVDDCIRWLGFSNDVYTQFKKMSVFVLPSLYGEGMPMVILEAMATGVPIVSTRVGGIEESIHHGEHGLLVEPGNANEMFLALENLLSGRVDGERLGSNARRRQIEHFSDRSMAKGVARIYDEVLNR